MASLTDVSFDYWKNRWDKNDNAWHRINVNKSLIKYWELLKSKPKSLVFFPLCGKTLDMIWVLSNGHSVIGVEYYEEPVKLFFQENNIEVVVERSDGYKLYKSIDGNLKIFVQDIFQFKLEKDQKFDIIIDRGSLVALNPNLREDYIKMLYNYLNEEGHIFFETLQYDQNIFGGPPFSVSDDEFGYLMKQNNLKYEIAHTGGYERKIDNIEMKELISIVSKC